MPVKQRVSVYLDAAMMQRLEALAKKQRQPKSAVGEAAILSFLTADDSDRWEAAMSRRMDRVVRQVERLERDQSFAVETLALFVRAWLTATPALPEAQQAAAQAKGRERYESFLDALGRRMARGQRLADEVTRDVEGSEDVADH